MRQLAFLNSLLDIKFQFRISNSKIDPVVYIIVKFQNLSTMIVGKCFISSMHFQWSIMFLKKKKGLIWLKKVSSIKKQPIRTVESFLKSKFELNQTLKMVLPQNLEIWNLNRNVLIYIHITKNKRKTLQLWEMSKTWRELDQVLTKKLLTETIPENIFEKSIEIQYNRTRIESFGIYLHNYRPILHNFTFSKGDWRLGYDTS